MTAGPSQPGGRSAAVAAWSAAALSAVAAAYAVVLRPGLDIPWDAVTFPVLFGVPGALIASRLPRHPVGWLMLAVGACFAANAVSLQLLASGQDAGSDVTSWWSDRGSAVVVPLTLALVLLLPDGRLPSRRWRPVVVATMTVQVAVVALWCLAPVLPATWQSFVEQLEFVLVLPFLLGIVAVGQRLRTPSDRPPVVGVLAGVSVFVLLVTVPDLVWPEGAQLFHIAGAAVLCGSIFGAVLRGGFDRAQVAISHALVYSVLTVAVLVAYVALVAASSRLGTPDELAGLLTAAVALGLLPVRRLLQTLLRRAMYGDRGDPQRALSRLSTSVAGSDDLPRVLDGIAGSVQASIRARWVDVEFRGVRAGVGTPDGEAHDELALDGGDGIGGTLRIGLAAGRSLSVGEHELLRHLVDHGARAARVVCLAEELAIARHTLVASREQERSRLRRDLHDDLGPILAGMAMQLGSLQHLVTEDTALAATRLQRLETEARAALERTRHLSRDLRPPTLDELGVLGAVVEAGRRLGVQVHVVGEPVAGLSPAAEVAAYRIATEAVVNAQRHGGAEQVEVSIRLDSGTLVVEVVDHGCGTAGEILGVGPWSMRERAEEIGGRVELRETPGGGVTVRATLPDAAAAVEAR